MNIIISSYGAWNAYPYNQQGSHTGYSYGGSGATGAPNPSTSSYSQYPQQQTNSQYPYGSINTVNANEYYSHYGYGAQQQQQQPTGVYADPNG